MSHQVLDRQGDGAVHDGLAERAEKDRVLAGHVVLQAVDRHRENRGDGRPSSANPDDLRPRQGQKDSP